MTKMKSKKMTKSTFAIIIMAVVMVAMLAFGGTYAYFTATANGFAELDPATTAVIKLDSDVGTSTAIQEVKTNVLPGEELAHIKASLTDSSTRDTYVFATVTLKFNGKVINLTGDKVVSLIWGQDNVWSSQVPEAKTGSYVFVITRNNRVDGTDDTTLSTGPIEFDLTLKLNEIHENFAQGEDLSNLDYMGKSVTVEVSFAAIQKDGFTAKDGKAAEQLAYAQIEAVKAAELADEGTGAQTPDTPAGGEEDND